MNITKIFFPLLVSLSLLFSACSSDGRENSEMARPSEEKVADTPTTKDLSPAEIGGRVGDLYVNAIKDIIDLLKDKPEPSDVESQAVELKENYIQKLVELGKLREQLSISDKGMLDSALRQKVYSVSSQPWYATFNEIQMHYFSNREFHKIILSFNIITQYAAFELLKKQEPEEAKRLGIEN